MKVVGSTHEWYVGFVPSPNRGLWRLAGGRFGHCMAFRPSARCWLLVEQNVWGLSCFNLDNDALRPLVDLCLRDGALLLVPSRRREFRWHAPPLLTCTTAVAALVGIRAWMLTPRHLHACLLRRGAKVISSSPLPEVPP